MKRLILSLFRMCGLDIRRYPPRPPSDITEDDRLIINQIAGRTATSVERQIALIQAVRYLVRHKIDGCIVECGVWKGGSSMAAALTLIQEGDTNRNLYLFDTFEGMTLPQDVDKLANGTLAQTILDHDSSSRCIASLDEVRRNMESTGYPCDRIKYIKGAVEATIPLYAPAEPIALLRLDTDWYESTKHELKHLFPLLCEGGILLIDDYGFWQGCRKAVDEFFASLGRPCYLHRIDDTGRLFVQAKLGNSS
jgi:O-methyltransferase